MSARVLVVNHAHSPICGIHDLGRRMHAALPGSAYAEANDQATYETAIAGTLPDAIIVNYRADLMPWWRPTGTPTFAVAHQYDAATVDRCAAGLLGAGFDRVLALDPGLTVSDPRVHAVGRPLPQPANPQPSRNGWEWTIGSFGFAFPHKGFQDVAAEMRETLDPPATYRLHMPEAYFNGAGGQPLYTAGIVAAVEEAAGPGIILELTTEHLAETELVSLLAGNDINCLLYVPGQPDAGLSSAVDYLIAARRPMLLSDASMFRHVPAPRWPATRLRDIIDDYHRYEDEAIATYEAMAGAFTADVEAVVHTVLS